MTDHDVRDAMYTRGWRYVMVMESIVITHSQADRTEIRIFCRSCLEDVVGGQRLACSMHSPRMFSVAIHPGL